MKSLLLCGFLIPALVHAQGTTTSVQDGDWDDSSTWDCNCVPEVDNAVVIHQVRIAGNTFLMQRVHVMPAGSLVMDEYFSVVIMDTVINDGLLELIGDIDVDWALLNNATIMIEGVMHNDGAIVMGGPNALIALDNIGNYDTIEGEGRICVAEYSENTGTIHGLIDFCDLTPTVAAPPFIDANSGSVAGSVTFCLQNCGPFQIIESGLSQARIGPVPAQDVLHVDAPAGTSFTLLDATGRAVLTTAFSSSGTSMLDVADLQPGHYTAVLNKGEVRLARNVLILR